MTGRTIHYGVSNQPVSEGQAGLAETIISWILLAAGLGAVVLAMLLLTIEYWL